MIHSLAAICLSSIAVPHDCCAKITLFLEITALFVFHLAFQCIKVQGGLDGRSEGFPP